jgi:hypothetical protein
MAHGASFAAVRPVVIDDVREAVAMARNVDFAPAWLEVQ